MFLYWKSEGRTIVWAHLKGAGMVLFKVHANENPLLPKRQSNDLSQKTSSGAQSTNDKLRVVTQRELQIGIDECVQLRVPGEKIKRWESEDKSVVIVSKDGVIKGVSSGRTLIWAHLNNGSVVLFKVAVRQ